MKKCFFIIKHSFYKLIITIFVSIPHLLTAQGKEALHIDSLLQVLHQIPDDTNKVNLLCDLSNTYWIININEGFRRSTEAMALAKKLAWKKGIAKAYSSLGSNYWANSEFVKAHECYLKSLKINEELGDKKDIAKSLHSIGVSYSTQFDKSKAIEYFERALKLFEETGDSIAALGCNLNIGQLYLGMNNVSGALQYFSEALQTAELTGRKRDYAFVLNMIGRAYANQKNYSKALEYEERSIKAFERIGQNNELAIQLGNAGEVFLMLGDYNRSLIQFKKAIKIFTQVKNRGEITYFGSWYGSIGKIQIILYKNQKKSGLAENTIDNAGNKLLEQAIYNLKKGLFICESVTCWIYSEDFNKALSEAYALQGNFTAAFDRLKISAAYKDSIFNTEKHDQMTRLELEYEFNKKKDSLNHQASLSNVQIQNEKKMSRFALKQQWLIIIVVIIGLCLIGVFFFFYYRTIRRLHSKNELIREKSEKQFKEKEYQQKVNDITASALRSQMNPHFIFNALNTIQSYIYSNDKKSAGNYLGKFSELIRKVLDNSNKHEISLEEEIHLLQLYIDIEKARFGDTICVTIDIDQNLESEHILVPPMLIQPYIENAIKHGLLHQTGEKKLMIKLRRSNDQQFIEIIIDDNGIGRKKSVEINKMRVGHHSFANDANEKRINLINQMSNKKTRLEIIDKKNSDGTPAGTTVIINIPVISMAAI